VRVSKLGGQVELEVIVVFDDGITDLDSLCGSLLSDLLLEQWLDSWVKLLSNVLNKD